MTDRDTSQDNSTTQVDTTTAMMPLMPLMPRVPTVPRVLLVLLVLLRNR